jgi:hypothetical protein
MKEPMVPLYAARVGDLKPSDFVIVECACGHSGLIHPTGLVSLGLGRMTRSLISSPASDAASVTRRAKQPSR